MARKPARSTAERAEKAVGQFECRPPSKVALAGSLGLNSRIPPEAAVAGAPVREQPDSTITGHGEDTAKSTRLTRSGHSTRSTPRDWNESGGVLCPTIVNRLGVAMPIGTLKH